MPTTLRATGAGRRLTALLGLAILALGGCSLLPPGTVPIALDEPLVTVQTHGGECPQGECRFTAEIWPDGRVVRSDGIALTVDRSMLDRLIRETAAADWDAILAVPFEGECPVNYDGQEQVYTFQLASEPVVVASCTTRVDPDAEPFRTVVEILSGSGS